MQVGRDIFTAACHMAPDTPGYDGPTLPVSSWRGTAQNGAPAR